MNENTTATAATSTLTTGSFDLDAIRQKVMDDTQAEIKRLAESLTRGAEKKLEKIRKNRPVVDRLVAAGLVKRDSVWTHGSSCSIELGFFPQTKAGNRQLSDKVRLIRQIIGCRLHVTGKDLADEKTRQVNFRLEPVGYDGISISFQRKLPRKKGENGPKCKIVRRSYLTLVCEA